jgi:hypothetical protein
MHLLAAPLTQVVARADVEWRSTPEIGQRKVDAPVPAERGAKQ